MCVCVCVHYVRHHLPQAPNPETPNAVRFLPLAGCDFRMRHISIDPFARLCTHLMIIAPATNVGQSSAHIALRCFCSDSSSSVIRHNGLGRVPWTQDGKDVVEEDVDDDAADDDVNIITIVVASTLPSRWLSPWKPTHIHTHNETHSSELTEPLISRWIRRNHISWLYRCAKFTRTIVGSCKPDNWIHYRCDVLLGGNSNL